MITCGSFSRTVDFGAGYFNWRCADFLFCLQIDSQTIETRNSSIIQINKISKASLVSTVDDALLHSFKG